MSRQVPCCLQRSVSTRGRKLVPISFPYLAHRRTDGRPTNRRALRSAQSRPDVASSFQDLRGLADERIGSEKHRRGDSFFPTRFPLSECSHLFQLPSVGSAQAVKSVVPEKAVN